LFDPERSFAPSEFSTKSHKTKTCQVLKTWQVCLFLPGRSLHDGPEFCCSGFSLPNAHDTHEKFSGEWDLRKIYLENFHNQRIIPLIVRGFLSHVVAEFTSRRLKLFP